VTLGQQSFGVLEDYDLFKRHVLFVLAYPEIG
jgi:hypothetical protein